MFKCNILTLFPGMIRPYTEESICKRAIEAGLVGIDLIDFREYTLDKHRRVDDTPYGGGAGMLIAPQSVASCFDDIMSRQEGKKVLNIYMSASGRTFDQSLSKELAGYDELNILCGHYEGVDQRVIDEYIDMEISIGDYILTGGELAAMVVVDSVIRHIPDVLGNSESTSEESFGEDGLLEYPQYTRPPVFHGREVPEVLMSGHHANIRKWQREQAILKTMKVRPDMIKKARLTPREMAELNREKEDREGEKDS